MRLKSCCICTLCCVCTQAVEGEPLPPLQEGETIPITNVELHQVCHRISSLLRFMQPMRLGVHAGISVSALVIMCVWLLPGMNVGSGADDVSYVL